jgi:response regulator of citrate/malate metabolism
MTRRLRGAKGSTTVSTVIIVEDRERIRRSLVEIVNNARGLKCIGSFGSCEQAMEGLKRAIPDVILMDI